ncbi:hypothetical protein [Klebsiella pneumoniae]|uniref:hypothetical protein n=1 Tax=Klebsiella pneumoniae TaxID=573 RepID=UPI00100A12AD|nr:hypothetical protein [Klebsiella pneumoniae]QAX10315.1 hypothetical protein C2M21_10720 [Klebsiella pneumoniae]HBX8397740.1 hypothetical protein [Klebsiella pneumoniae]HBZ7579031.1 hypothetical protein [Klebsiella pneumoniae]HBZ7816103.1 hypothetical protein [Klebsiella pneumoniae]HBZ7864203.1 hypothetical protein [Klebsiella pneumoniae]
MTDITELARERLKEKFDAWFEREYKHLESSKYTDAVPHIKYGFWTAYQAGGAELVEALEKKNAELGKYAGELESHKAALLKFIRESCYVFDGYDADISDAYIDAASSNLMPKIEAEPCHHCSDGSYSGLPGGACEHCMGTGLDNPAAELESRTVKLPDDEDGQAYGFGKWANGKLPATAGTMTIAYCEDAWRAAFQVFSSAVGIKWEAE